MTPPLPKALVRRLKAPKIIRCPTCGRYHELHHEFGMFCCASCLQMPIRPLIVVSK